VFLYGCIIPTINMRSVESYWRKDYFDKPISRSSDSELTTRVLWCLFRVAPLLVSLSSPVCNILLFGRGLEWLLLRIPKCYASFHNTPRHVYLPSYQLISFWFFYNALTYISI
jgi:hypothetical protein